MRLWVLILFVWISFFPAPIQEKYHLATKIFLICAFTLLLMRKRVSLFKLSDYPLWIFLVAISINILFAQQKNIAFKTYLDLAIPLFSIYYLASGSFHSQKSFNLLTKTICISSIVVSLGGIFESMFAVNPLYEHFIENPFYLKHTTHFMRPMSTLFNPVVLGSYLLGCLPFNFLLFKQSKSFLRLLGAVGTVLNVIVIISTFSRGVFLGLIAMIVFYPFTQKKYRSVLIFFIILFIFILLCSYSIYPFNRFGGAQMIVTNRGILSSYRFDRITMTQRIIKDYPLFGLGFKHFRLRFYEYYPRRNEIFPYEFMIADNMYLTILAETGIIGFLGFFIFIWFMLRRSFCYLRKIKEGENKDLLITVLVGLIGLLVNMGAYELFYWTAPFLFFCILIGMLVNLSQGVLKN